MLVLLHKGRAFYYIGKFSQLPYIIKHRRRYARGIKAMLGSKLERDSDVLRGEEV